MKDYFSYNAVLWFHVIVYQIDYARDKIAIQIKH